MKNEQQLFGELLDLTEQLLGPNGCPWDRKQTFESFRSDIIEEVYELVEAIDNQDTHSIIEEVADVLFCAVFITKMGEKDKLFHMEDVISSVRDKLVRRHPHVFGDASVDTPDEALDQWEKIKKKEKPQRKKIFEDIPKGLPALARAQDVLKKLQHRKYCQNFTDGTKENFQNEDELGEALLNIVDRAQNSGFDAEHALRQTLSKHMRNAENNINA